MKLSEQDRKAILEEAARAGINAVFVFGSSLRSDTEANDIDVAVRGVPAARSSGSMPPCRGGCPSRSTWWTWIITIR